MAHTRSPSIRGTGSVARALRALVAIAVLIATVIVYLDGSQSPTFRPLNFFSYFTIISNLLTAYLMGRQAIQPSWLEGNGSFRGAVTLYMTITGLVYAFILRPIGADVGNYRPWIDFIHHTAAPVAVIQDWLLFPPRRPLRSNVLYRWLIFPALYLVYSFVRGPRAEWYPYPFLDPRFPGGYGRVAIFSVIVFLIFLGGAVFVRWWAGHQPTGGLTSG